MQSGFILPLAAEPSPILVTPRKTAVIRSLQKRHGVIALHAPIKADSALDVDFKFLEENPFSVAVDMRPGPNAPYNVPVIGKII